MATAPTAWSQTGGRQTPTSWSQAGGEDMTTDLKVNMVEVKYSQHIMITTAFVEMDIKFYSTVLIIIDIRKIKDL